MASLEPLRATYRGVRNNDALTLGDCCHHHDEDHEAKYVKNEMNCSELFFPLCMPEPDEKPVEDHGYA
ncbi:MAG: hypothetical protein CMI26_11330 [Opitutae bacterium]|nr:hypothetical protein [Opitutae bacterium]